METSTTFPGYFYYTLSALILPFVVNILLVLRQLLAKDKNHTIIEIGFSRRKCLPKMSPVAYQTIYFFWVLALLVFYPLVTKIVYIVNTYKLLKTKKNATLTNKATKKEDTKETIDEFQLRQENIASEVVLSEIVLAVTALTFQPLVQLFSLRNTLISCYSDDGYGILEVISYPQFRSIVACVLGFALTLTTHSIHVKHTNDNISKLPIHHLSARIILFMSYLCQMVGRLMLLVYSSAIIFKTYDHLELLIVLHVIVISVVHILDYFCIKKLSPNLICVSFWIEMLLNGCASVFIPSDVSLGEEVWRNKKDGGPGNRSYVSNTTRLILIYGILVTECAVLIGFALSEKSSLIPISVSIVLIFVGILFHIMYYCFTYPWPLGISSTPFLGVICSKENKDVKNYPSLLDTEGQEVLSNYKVGGLEMEVATPKISRTPRTPRSRSRIAFSIPDEETEM